MVIITPSMCIVTDAGRYYFVYWICLIHAVAVAGVAQSQDCGSKSCGEGHAVVQQRLRKAILPCQQLRTRQE